MQGIGKVHSKWSPVCTAVFQFDPIININASVMDDLDEQQKQDWCVRFLLLVCVCLSLLLPVCVVVGVGGSYGLMMVSG